MALPQYQIRPFRHGTTDISAIRDISALGNEHDELTKYMTRNARQMWTSYRAGFYRYLRLQVLNPGTVCYIAENRATEEITRHGDSPQAKAWQRPNSSFLKAAERKLLAAEKAYYKYVPNVDPTRDQKRTKQIMPLLGEEWPTDVFSEFWELDALYVHPRCYRQGIGKLLMRWGVERGRAENVPLLVYSSQLGKILYESVGFEVVRRMAELDAWIPEFIEALREKSGNEARGAWAMCWQPEGTDFLERARRKAKEGEGSGKAD